MMKKLFLLFAVMAMALGAAAVNPDYQETENGVTSNKIVVVGCRAAVGRVYNSGVYDRGFCWSTSPNPTVSNSRTSKWYYDNDNDGTTPSGSSRISSDAGTIYIMEGMQPSTRYYIRPYIQSSRNGSYTYGKQYVVWTLPAADWVIYGNWDHYGEAGYEDQTAYINSCLEKHCGGTSNASSELSWLTSCKQEAQDLFNTWTAFEKRVTLNFSEWEDGAHCSWGGDPSFGPGFTRNTGTFMHELGHNLGVGQEWRYTGWDSPLHPTYLWTGERANRVFTLFEDKPDEPRNADGSFPYGGNHTISDGDRVHVCYGLTGNIPYIYRVRQAIYYQGMHEDGLSCAVCDAGPYYSFETAAYMNGNSETDLNTKYYITNEDIATCNRYLCEENGKLTYKKITSRSSMLSNNAFAWYVIYNPSNAFYYIKNVSTGHYFTYSGSDFTMQSNRGEPTKLMPSRNNSTVNGQTLKAYWMLRSIDWGPTALSASRINRDVAANADFNLYDDAGYERWFILTADQVNAIGNVTDNSENKGLELITSLPSDYSKYFFVLADTQRDLTMMQWDSNNNGNDNDQTGTRRKSAFYRSRIDLRNDQWALWTFTKHTENSNEYQILTNITRPDVQMQTGAGAPWYFRTDNNDLSSSRTRISYDTTNQFWTVFNVQNGGNNYLGVWDESAPADWKEMAFNTYSDLRKGKFNLYQLLRGEYVKYYTDYAGATPGNPLNITYVLENPGAERQNNAIGWKVSGNAWSTPSNNSLAGKVGSYYFSISTTAASTLYQDIYGLPAGYYRLSAVATGGTSNNLALIANGHTNAQTIVPAANDGTRSTVIVQLADGETLRVGMKALGNSSTSVRADDVKLEYIGTNVADYNVGSPVLTFADGAYVDEMTSFTYDFVDAVTMDNSVAFTILNSSAKAAIKKNGTTVYQGSFSLYDRQLTADFSGWTPERNTTYTLTLPAGVVGYAGHASNSQLTITFHTTAIPAGFYYLRNNDSSWNTYYLSRGGGGSQAYMDEFGLAVHIDTDQQGGTSIQYFDSRQWLYGDGWTWSDQGDINNALKFTVEAQGNNIYKFKTRGRSDNGYLAIWDGKAVCDGRPGDNLLGNTNQWVLESLDEHRDNYTRLANAQASALGLSGVSTWAQLETLMDESYSSEVVFTDIPEVTERYQWGSNYPYEEKTLTGLTNGIYRVTIYAHQRACHWDWLWNVDNTYGAREARYLYAGSQKTQIKATSEEGDNYTNTSGMHQHNGLYYPDNMASSDRAFNKGHFKNTVYVRVTNGTLTFGLIDPNSIPAVAQWICYKNIKVERMIAGTGIMDLKADVEDGAYIGAPITKLTLSPASAATSATLASGTKVTLYKNDVQVRQITPTLSGTNLIVALPTLDLGATYKVTLDANRVTYNGTRKNTAFQTTFKTPYIYDGTYYLYQPLTDDFIGHTYDPSDVRTTFLGQSVTWTNETKGGTIRFTDNNKYVGGRWWTEEQNGQDDLSVWTLIPFGDGSYKIHRTVDNRDEYLYVTPQAAYPERLGSNGHHRDDGRDDDINFDNNWDYAKWLFIPENEYADYVRILSETSGEAPTATAGPVKVVFKRALTKDTWHSLCLPFAMSREQLTAAFGDNTVVKTFCGAVISGGNASLGFIDTTTGGIEANTPCILRTDQELPSEFQWRGITLTPATDLSLTANGIQFIGSYTYPTVLRNTDGTDFYVQDNTTCPSSGSTQLKAYSAYFHVPASLNIQTLTANFDGEATDVEAMNNEEFTIHNAEVYDLQGRRVNTLHLSGGVGGGLPKGLYIVNGRKVLVK